jgi:hypothetical protein
MMKNIVLIFFIVGSTTACAQTQILTDSSKNYVHYHRQIAEAERLIGDKSYEDALNIYQNIFNSYDFIFLRDYQVATQLAIHVNKFENAKQYLRKGMAAGWKLRSIKKNKFLKKLGDDTEWKTIKNDYAKYRAQYESKLNQSVHGKVKKMFSKDQRKAIGALLRFTAKGRDRYATRKFAPHSEKQMQHLNKILDELGYPGERLIGNSFWMSTILSHHNSISYEYTRSDTIYQFLKPKLLRAIEMGQMSPWEFAIADDWYLAVSANRKDAGYGYLNAPSTSQKLTTNKLRERIGLRTVEIRNRLIDIETLTGMNFYLPGRPWVDGKIVISEPD